MKKLYIVTSGSYSDYRIDAIFNNRKLAENYIKAFIINDFNDIEEWVLNPNNQEIKDNYKAYQVIMNRNGDVTSVEIAKSIWSHREYYGIREYGVNQYFINCYAKDEKHAIKIANEKRIKYKIINNK